MNDFEVYWAEKWEVAFGNMTGALSAGFKEIALEAWQASRAVALEDAAVECEVRIGQSGMEYDSAVLDEEAQGCADAVRELKEQS